MLNRERHTFYYLSEDEQAEDWAWYWHHTSEEWKQPVQMVSVGESVTPQQFGKMLGQKK